MNHARFAAVLAVVAALGVVAQDVARATEERVVSGALAYRERIALPPDSGYAVAVRDGAGDLVAETGGATDGGQVPLSFSLAVPPDVAEATLDAVIRFGATPRWVLEDVPIPPGEGDVDLGTLVLRPHQPMGFSSTFRCGEKTVRIGFSGENAVLEVDGVRTVLSPVETAEGALWRSAEDPGTAVRHRGARTEVRLAGRRLPPCRME